MLHGCNQHADLLCQILKLGVSCQVPEDGRWPVGRFRDIYLNEDGTEIHLLTRNGGGNRDCWNETDDSAPGNCDCPGCVQCHWLPKHENYISDADDDFDCTFAITRFSVPAEHLERTKNLATGIRPQTLEEKTHAAVERVQGMSADELRADPKLGQLITQLENAFENTPTVVMIDKEA